MADAAAAVAAAAAAASATPLSTRSDPRRSHRSQFHARVRADALARQRAARGEGLEAARRSRMMQQEGGGAGASGSVAAVEAPVGEAESDDGRGGGEAASSGSSPSSSGPARPFWARQLMRHEWMVDVPEDLAANWLVLPRPEGVRCLLVSGRGKTVARGRNGAVLLEFASLLPGGGGGQSCCGGGGGGGTEGSCVLDAVFQPDDPPVPGAPAAPGGSSSCGTFFALDVLSWGGRDLSGCDAAFRLSFWLPTKLAEAGCRRCSPAAAAAASLPPSPAGSVARVVPLAAVGASPEGILAAVAAGESGSGSGSGLVRDGVLFVHRESAYSCDEANPLALVWKDGSCSRYVVETDAQGRALERQSALLRVVEARGGGGGGGVGALAAATGDDPPVPLAPVPAPPPIQALSSSSPEQQQQQLSFTPGRLLRFAVGPAGFSFGGSGAPDADAAVDAAPSAAPAPSVSADLEFVAALPSSSNRLRGAGGGADTLSKLLFQHAARHGLLPTLEALLDAARRSCPSGDEEMNLG